MSPKGSRVKAWFPSAAMFRSGAFWKWSDREGSDFISGLTHWWIHIWMDYLEMVEIAGGGRWLERVGPWGCALGLYIVPASSFLSLCFLTAVRWAALLHHTLLHSVLHCYLPRNNGACWLWTETVSPNTHFLPWVAFFKYSVTVKESWLAQWVKGSR